jgi:hypothetical protein
MPDFYEHPEDDDDAPVDLSEVYGTASSRSEFESAFDEDEGSGDGVSSDVNATEMMLLSYLTANHDLWIRCAGILRTEYFSPEMQPVVDLLRRYENKNQTMPSTMVVRADTGVGLETPVDTDHSRVMDDMAVRVEEFCRFRAAGDFLLESATIMQEDRSRATMQFLVGEMARIASISVQQDLGYEVHIDAAKLLEEAKKSDGLPVGYMYLDQAMNGGVTKPSYNIVSAASGQGKSIFLQNTAINYARQGHNVVYISLELPEFMLEKRFAAMMTETSIHSIYQNIDSILLKMKMSRSREGKIQIKRLPMNGTTLADIRAYVAELIASTGEVWEHIMLDYPDLMKPINPDIKMDNIHLRDQAVAMEIYDWAHEKGSTKVIWGASQQTKGAKDEKDARQSGVAGGTGKVNTCDNLVIFKRSLEDQRAQRTWAYIEKGRNGGNGIRIPFHWNGETQRMSNREEDLELFEKANRPDDDGDAPKKQTRNDPLIRAKQTEETKQAQMSQTTSDIIKARLTRKR